MRTKWHGVVGHCVFCPTVLEEMQLAPDMETSPKKNIEFGMARDDSDGEVVDKATLAAPPPRALFIETPPISDDERCIDPTAQSSSIDDAVQIITPCATGVASLAVPVQTVAGCDPVGMESHVLTGACATFLFDIVQTSFV